MRSTGQLRSAVGTTLGAAAPWRTGQPWWVVALEGLAAVGLGVWIWLATRDAVVLSGQLLALALLVVGALGLWAGLRGPLATAAARLEVVRSTIGLMTGLLIFALLGLGVLTLDAGLAIMAVGMLLFGALGVAVAAADRAAGRRLSALITGVLFAAIGGLLLLRPGPALFRAALGAPLVAGGAALLALAAGIWYGGRAAGRAPSRGRGEHRPEGSRSDRAGGPRS